MVPLHSILGNYRLSHVAYDGLLAAAQDCVSSLLVENESRSRERAFLISHSSLAKIEQEARRRLSVIKDSILFNMFEDGTDDATAGVPDRDLRVSTTQQLLQAR